MQVIVAPIMSEMHFESKYIYTEGVRYHVLSRHTQWGPVVVLINSQENNMLGLSRSFFQPGLTEVISNEGPSASEL